MNKSELQHFKRSITTQVLLHILLETFVIDVIIGSLIFLSIFTTSKIIWQPNNPLYFLLSLLMNNFYLIVSILMASSAIVAIIRGLLKMTQYLNEVTSAIGELYSSKQERIQLSEILAPIEDQLETMRSNLIKSEMEAVEAVQRKNDLLVYLAHDLKTPLTSVIGYLTLLHDEEQISQELSKKYLSVSLSKAERLEDLINEFFEITRFNLSSLELSKSKVNITLMLEQTAFELNPLLKEKHLSCEFAIKENIFLDCDADKLQRVFDNLLRNAVNYSHENCTILLYLQIQNNNAVITVENNGDTIPKDRLSRLFEQFYRLDTARTTKTGGAGLGLAIAKEIVDAHNGTILATSNENIIKFTVSLPL